MPGSRRRKWVSKSAIPNRSSDRPVSIEARDGLHTDCWQYACRYQRPRAAKASRFGVLTDRWPSQPTRPPKSSATINSTLGEPVGGGGGSIASQSIVVVSRNRVSGCCCGSAARLRHVPWGSPEAMMMQPMIAAITCDRRSADCERSAMAVGVGIIVGAGLNSSKLIGKGLFGGCRRATIPTKLRNPELAFLPIPFSVSIVRVRNHPIGVCF